MTRNITKKMFLITDHRNKPDALDEDGHPKLFKTSRDALRYCYANQLNETSGPTPCTIVYKKRWKR